MDLHTLVVAAILGLIEGATEFIPVSSTAHLLIVGHLLGFKNTNGAFEVMIQLGAILALVSVYAARLWHLVTALPHDRQVQRFTIGVVIAFLPAAFFGVLLHDLITHVFFESLTLICTALLVGGVILLILDRVALKPRHTDIMQFPIRLAFGIGLFQCLALIPGVSRSGATIGGALVLGADKRAAAEYSFFLAMPTMAGAFTYNLYKNIDQIDGGSALAIAVGFVVAFLAALVVVRGVLGFISRRGFAPFAWWRIAVGGIGLIWIFLTPPAPGTATVEASGGGALAIELSARSVAPEIGRENGFEARRLDAEASKRASLGGSRGGDDVVDLQLAQLVGRDQRVRQILQH